MVTPDEMCAEYGADTFRMYVMARGPLGVSRPWEPRGDRRSPALPPAGVADRRRRADRRHPCGRRARRARRPEPCCTRRSTPYAATWTTLSFNTAIARLMELSRHVAGLPGALYDVVATARADGRAVRAAPGGGAVVPARTCRVAHDGGLSECRPGPAGGEHRHLCGAGRRAGCVTASRSRPASATRTCGAKPSPRRRCRAGTGRTPDPLRGRPRAPAGQHRAALRGDLRVWRRRPRAACPVGTRTPPSSAGSLAGKRCRRPSSSASCRSA